MPLASTYLSVTMRASSCDRLNSHERYRLYADLLTEMFRHLKPEDVRFIVHWVGCMNYLEEAQLLRMWDGLPTRFRTDKGQAAAQVLREVA